MSGLEERVGGLTKDAEACRTRTQALESENAQLAQQCGQLRAMGLQEQQRFTDLLAYWLSLFRELVWVVLRTILTESGSSRSTKCFQLSEKLINYLGNSLQNSFFFIFPYFFLNSIYFLFLN